MRPIIKRNLRAQRWSMFWWSVGITAFITLELGVYSSVRSQADQLNQALGRLPSSVRSFFGGSNDLFSPVGYLNSRLFYLLLPMLLSILAIGLGSSLIAREEKEGTVELLLGRPISRAKLLLSKALSGLLIVGIITLVAVISAIALVKIVDLPVPLPRIGFAAFMAGLISLLFGTIAFTVTALGKKGRGAAIGIAVLIGLGGYIISSLESSVSWLSWPAKLLPYHYYNPTAILNGEEFTWPVAMWFTIGILTLGFISYLAFRDRDIGA